MTTVAILVPCFNEVVTIAKVVSDFRRELPSAEIHVFDNNSTDGTGAAAAAAGAQVHCVRIQGKGAVVRQMFCLVDVDIAVMVDGDDTYPANRVHDLIKPVIDREADMVVGTRLATYEGASFRPLHIFGNQLVRRSINFLFDARLGDVLSGYRVFSRRYILTTPVLARGFEVETELTCFALEHQMNIIEIPVNYGSRPANSTSKLNTFRDGYRVLSTVLRLYKDYQPLTFFGVFGLIALFCSLFLGFLIIEEFFTLGRAGPARAVLAGALGVVGVLSVATGLILDTTNRRARELFVVLTNHLAAISTNARDAKKN